MFSFHGYPIIVVVAENRIVPDAGFFCDILLRHPMFPGQFRHSEHDEPSLSDLHLTTL